MTLALSLFTAFFSALAASILTHTFTVRRADNEYRLRKLEELLEALHAYRLISIELYELYLSCAHGRTHFPDPLAFRDRTIEIGRNYKMPQFIMATLTDVYFPSLAAPVNDVINSLGALCKIDSRLFTANRKKSVDHESQNSINRCISQFDVNDRNLRRAIRDLAAVLRKNPINIFQHDKYKMAEQTDAPNPHAFGTSGISAAEQPRMPEASGDR